MGGPSCYQMAIKLGSIVRPHEAISPGTLAPQPPCAAGTASTTFQTPTRRDREIASCISASGRHNKVRFDLAEGHAVELSCCRGRMHAKFGICVSEYCLSDWAFAGVRGFERSGYEGISVCKYTRYSCVDRTL